MTCWRPQTCRNFAKEHPSTSCPTAKDPRLYNYSNCKGKHQACDKSCPAIRAKAERAAAAYDTRPLLYMINSNPHPASANLLFNFHSLPSHTPSLAYQSQQPSQPQTICKRAWQSTAPAAGERAEDGSIAGLQTYKSLSGARVPNAMTIVHESISFDINQVEVTFESKSCCAHLPRD